jgi:hypothetical protein
MKGKEKSLVQDSFDETSLAKRPIGILTETSPSDTTARIVHNEDSIVLELKSPVGVKMGVELLTLPQWQHLSDASASVICPQTKHEKIDIVLSAAADPLFEVSGTVRRDRAYLQLHVPKDQRAVAVERDTNVRRRLEGMDWGSRFSPEPVEGEQDVKFVKTNGFAIKIGRGRGRYGDRAQSIADEKSSL